MYWLILLLLPGGGEAYFADWSLLAREREPTCVDIPTNMTLCHDIGNTISINIFGVFPNIAS